MTLAFKNAKVYKDHQFTIRNLVFRNNELVQVDDLSAEGLFDSIYENCLILPGLADVHVHLREPGFSYKETISSGSRAAARGGYTVVCSMPNLKPVPDSKEHLKEQLELIQKDAVIRVLPYGAITQGEQGEILADLSEMAEDVCAFSDDGKGVQQGEMMKSAMLQAKQLGKLIAAHCEVNELLKGGYIHDGSYARDHGHRGICSASEYEQIARDIKLSEETGCSYHVCHISAKESVELIREAKKRGVDISCETGPHYLLLCEEDLKEEGRFKMNPPLRSREDQKALLEGILDGTVDMIATDHAPHSAEEKSKGLEKSLMGIVGLETAFPLLYTYLVLPGILPLERLVELMADAPKKRFSLDTGNDFTVFQLGEEHEIDPEQFLSMGRATPFAGWKVEAKCLLTVCRGQVAFQEKA